MGWGSHIYAAKNRQELRLTYAFQSNYPSEKANLPQRNCEMGQNDSRKPELSDPKKNLPTVFCLWIQSKHGLEGSG